MKLFPKSNFPSTNVYINVLLVNSGLSKSPSGLLNLLRKTDGMYRVTSHSPSYAPMNVCNPVMPASQSAKTFLRPTANELAETR